MKKNIHFGEFVQSSSRTYRDVFKTCITVEIVQFINIYYLFKRS